MLRSVAVLLLLTAGAAGAAQAQSINGNNNGNNNTGVGSGNGNGNGNGNSSSATVNNKRTSPTVVAPGLAAAGTESCLGSTSMGGAGAGIGLSFGTTVTDRGCNLRLYARTLHALGHRQAATQILCNDPQVAQALAVEGIICQTGPNAPIREVSAGQQVRSSTDQGACRHYELFRGCLD